MVKKEIGLQSEDVGQFKGLSCEISQTTLH